MRIRDWSSDVCSSDLARLCRAETERPDQSLLLRRQAAGADPRLYAHAGFPGAATRREPDRLCACRKQFHPRAHHPQRTAQPPLAAHRSEEHTSELQSLMRLSYAVFSLYNKIFLIN